MAKRKEIRPDASEDRCTGCGVTGEERALARLDAAHRIYACEPCVLVAIAALTAPTAPTP